MRKNINFKIIVFVYEHNNFLVTQSLNFYFFNYIHK